MKHTARQFPAEERYPIDPYDYDEFYDGIIVVENRNYFAHVPKAYKELYELISDGTLYEDFSACIDGLDDAMKYAEIASSINYYLPRFYSSDKEFLSAVYDAVMDKTHSTMDYICGVMSAFTKSCFVHRSIRGCFQSEWVEIIYDSSLYAHHEIEMFRKLFFGEFEEWLIDDDYSCYTFAETSQGEREELAEIIGCNPDEIEIYRFVEYERKPVWEKE